MLYVKIENGKAVSASDEFPKELSRLNAPTGMYEFRADWGSFERAQQVARELNTVKGYTVYVAIDSGENHYPRYDVIELPKIGDEVSYSFNGDTYPDGKIVSVSLASKNHRIVKTDTGSVYYRRKQSGSWIKAGGTWSLVQGHRNERNPSF